MQSPQDCTTSHTKVFQNLVFCVPLHPNLSSLNLKYLPSTPGCSTGAFEEVICFFELKMSHIQHLARSAEEPCKSAVSLLHRHPGCRAEEDRRKEGRTDRWTDTLSRSLQRCSLCANSQLYLRDVDKLSFSQRRWWGGHWSTKPEESWWLRVIGRQLWRQLLPPQFQPLYFFFFFFWLKIA